jgi:NAD(P)-dependent dehydrogenase (short-subunit alcohol dehydrogenase family)
VVPVRYLKSDQIADMITAALPDVTVQPGPQENTLLITANDKQWEAILEVHLTAPFRMVRAAAEGVLSTASHSNSKESGPGRSIFVFTPASGSASSP